MTSSTPSASWRWKTFDRPEPSAGCWGARGGAVGALSGQVYAWRQQAETQMKQTRGLGVALRQRGSYRPPFTTRSRDVGRGCQEVC